VNEVKRHINDVLRNWGHWCRGGWPPLGYATPPTSRDYWPPNQSDKKHKAYEVDAVSGEIANLAIVNLALNGDTRSYQIITAWWAHHRPAKLIAKKMHCSQRSVYYWRDIAMEAFWCEYLAELEKIKYATG